MPGRAKWTTRFRRTDGRRLHALALVLGALLAGCGASKQAFVPLERVHGQTEHGYNQALYPLQGPTGTFGEAVVWSRGAYPTHDGTTVIHVALTVHNTSSAPLAIDAADVSVLAVRTRGVVLEALPAAERTKTSVAPQARAQAVFHFRLPADVSPKEIESFSFAWAVHGPASVYYQRTPFAEPEARGVYYGPYDRYPCWPYGPYDCSWGPPPAHVILVRDRDRDPENGRIQVQRRR
jgi:hypothetical protein